MGDETAPQGMWCKVCKEPVTLTGSAGLPQEMRAAVHVATGLEAGPGPGDGTHLAVPTPQDPVLREQADAIERDFPQFKVSVRLGYFRAAWRDGAVRPAGAAPFCTARDEQKMRERLRSMPTGHGDSCGTALFGSVRSGRHNGRSCGPSQVSSPAEGLGASR